MHSPPGHCTSLGWGIHFSEAHKKLEPLIHWMKNKSHNPGHVLNKVVQNFGSLFKDFFFPSTIADPTPKLLLGLSAFISLSGELPCTRRVNPEIFWRRQINFLWRCSEQDSTESSSLWKTGKRLWQLKDANWELKSHNLNNLPGKGTTQHLQLSEVIREHLHSLMKKSIKPTSFKPCP